jgi:hypothetical protein
MLGMTLVAARADAQTAVASVTSVSAVAPVRVSDYHVAASNYFRVSTRDVAVIRDRRVRDEDLPVVLFISQRASRAPATVVDLRLRGFTWWDIAVRYRLGADVFFVASAGIPAFSKPRNQWNTIVLSDADIVSLVNLRFLSEHYRVPAHQIMELRGRTGDFVAVQREISGRR